jgi:putative toxin-antitoxin system antitoxin component (TIGR02293 family)
MSQEAEMAFVRRDEVTDETEELGRIAALLGGERVLGRALHSRLDAHMVIYKGLPSGALFYFVRQLGTLQTDTGLETVLGMTKRTLQRYRAAAGKKPLNPELSGRMWQAAEILAKATAVLGSQEEAEQWLERPAIGLDQHRPIDLLSTPTGIKIVEEFLDRVRYGVYA